MRGGAGIEPAWVQDDERGGDQQCSDRSRAPSGDLLPGKFHGEAIPRGGGKGCNGGEKASQGTLWRKYISITT